MRYLFPIFLFLLSVLNIGLCKAQNFVTHFEKSGEVETAEYKDVITFYQKLAKQYPAVSIKANGKTDADAPLHLVTYTNDGIFDKRTWKLEDRIVILINNGIHAGEPDGIDASMMLLRDAAMGKIKVPDNVVLCVIPVFNIGGALSRNSTTRANQNGPLEYGFRGNGQYLDLNRDFIKSDAFETRTLIDIFHFLDPDIFIDNHVSNGADYQHVMTLLSTQHNKLGEVMGKYLKETLEPAIYASMKKKDYDLVPYVNVWDTTPDNGWQQFIEGARFASGFAALFQTYAFVPETHMLKPYGDRVWATYELMRSFISVASKQAADIKDTRKQQRAVILSTDSLPIAWQADTTKYSTITFKGYEAGYKPSDVSGNERLYYDRKKPFTKEMPFYDYYHAQTVVDVPNAYIVPHGWHEVVNRLKLNNVKMRELKRDTVIYVSAYKIKNYETVSKPYEGHYLHYNIVVEKGKDSIRLLKGDYIIPVNQQAKRYIVEALEPHAPDGFFAWGFFDAVLQQKEHFSDYVFEDRAVEILKNDPTLKKELEDRRKTDKAFAEDGHAQLEYIYQNSPHMEAGYMRYPVFRVE